MESDEEDVDSQGHTKPNLDRGGDDIGGMDTSGVSTAEDRWHVATIQEQFKLPPPLKISKESDQDGQVDSILRAEYEERVRRATSQVATMRESLKALRHSFGLFVDRTNNHFYQLSDVLETMLEQSHRSRQRDSFAAVEGG